MTKVEVPTSVTLYIQWIPQPFKIPQVAGQESANSKWALTQTKELLEAKSIDSGEVKLVKDFNGKVYLEIVNPEMKGEDGKEFWEEMIGFLKGSDKIVSISVFVNNETSEKIALNLADRVDCQWHRGYQGYKKETIIYHK